MRVMWNIGKRGKGDTRYTLVRLETNRFIYRQGWSLSISLHPFLWKWHEGYQEFRLTLLGVNIHYRKA